MDYREKDYKVFELYSSGMALACAGSIDDYNCCTIGWGSLGNIWGHERGIVTIYINPDRYTWEFCMKKDYFTVPSMTMNTAMTCGYWERSREEMAIR